MDDSEFVNVSKLCLNASDKIEECLLVLEGAGIHSQTLSANMADEVLDATPVISVDRDRLGDDHDRANIGVPT